jgi:hypothetical protein
VRANAVRALGHFARFAPRRVLLARDELAVANVATADDDQPHRVTLLYDIVATLLTRLTSGSAKARWNACYALGRCSSIALNDFLALLYYYTHQYRQ